VNVAVGFDVLLNCANNRLGPLDTLHAPVPITATLPANVAEPLAQIVCGLPAFEVVGGASTVIVTLEAEAAQGALVIVQVRT
jgi:hypothetical protein